MKRRRATPYAAGGGFNIIEEATSLLRSTPKATLAMYYAGVVPFVMGFFYFWTDMSRNPFARQHSSEAAFGIALLFLWMKFWQALFCARLRSEHAMRSVPPWSWRQSLHVLLVQTILHSIGLLVLPVAVVLLIPLAWVYAFYQNATVLADPESNAKELAKRSWKQATLWPEANHVLLGVLFLFGIFVFVNWMSLFIFTPVLLRMLLGIETEFSRSPISMINTTSVIAALLMTYMCVDPLSKAAYLLRCFYGASRSSGEDLKTELRQARVPARTMIAVLLAIACAGSYLTVVRAQSPEASPTVERSTIDPAVLDQKIDIIIHQSRYTWRMPRTAPPPAEDGLLRRFVMASFRFVRNVIRTVADWIERLLEWIFGGSQRGNRSPGFDTVSHALPYLLIIVAAGVLAAVLLRLRKRKTALTPVATVVVPATPDIASENVAADQLPEDGWTTMARQLLERGEYRLAIRAFYLATLAHLAQRNLVGIARFKSNRDYELELRRRAHAIPGMLTLFSENLSIFERTWYGMHDVSRELVQDFAATVDRIRSAA